MSTQKIGGIYAIQSPTDAIYVGQSVDIYKRFCLYRNLHCKSQPRIYNSLKKHTPEKHIFRIVYLMGKNASQVDYDYREQEIIRLFKDNGYELLNLTIGGGGIRGYKWTDQQRKKMSEAKKGKRTGSEGTFFGKKHTEETKKIISEKRKLIKLTLSHKEKLHNSRRGKPAWNSGIKYSSEQKLNVYNGWLGKKHLLSTIEKMRRSSNRRKKCYQYDRDNNFIKEWNCVGDAARELNIQRSDIGACCRDKLKTAGNFIWKYERIL